MICAVVENFRHRVASEKPTARGKSARFKDSFQQGGDVIAEAEAVAVEQFYRISTSPRALHRPAGDVVPVKPGSDETAIGQEKAPDGFGLLTGSLGLLGVDGFGKLFQIGRIGLAAAKHFGRIDLRARGQRREKRANPGEER